MSNIFTWKISVERDIIPSISFEVDKSETISVASYGSSKTRGKLLLKILNLNSLVKVDILFSKVLTAADSNCFVNANTGLCQQLSLPNSTENMNWKNSKGKNF